MRRPEGDIYTRSNAISVEHTYRTHIHIHTRANPDAFGASVFVCIEYLQSFYRRVRLGATRLFGYSAV